MKRWKITFSLQNWCSCSFRIEVEADRSLVWTVDCYYLFKMQVIYCFSDVKVNNPLCIKTFDARESLLSLKENFLLSSSRDFLPLYPFFYRENRCRGQNHVISSMKTFGDGNNLFSFSLFLSFIFRICPFMCLCMCKHESQKWVKLNCVLFSYIQAVLHVSFISLSYCFICHDKLEVMISFSWLESRILRALESGELSFSSKWCGACHQWWDEVTRN